MNPSFESSFIFNQLKAQHQVIQAVDKMMKNMVFVGDQASGKTQDFQDILNARKMIKNLEGGKTS